MSRGVSFPNTGVPCTEEDRRERRRKLGLPEELTEEERAAERAKQAERERAKAAHALPVRRVTLATQLRDTLVRRRCRCCAVS